MQYYPITGNWLNPSNGETFDIYQNDYGQYVLVYYKEDGGVPTWYITDVAYMAGNSLTFPLYYSRWNYATSSIKPLLQVGTVTVSFSSNTAATFNWSIYGLFGSGSFVSAYAGGRGRTGMYYPGSTPGLGAMFGSYGNFVMANFAYYDGAGNPIWARGIAYRDPVIYYYLYAGNSNNIVGTFTVFDSGYFTYFNAHLNLPNFQFQSEPFFLLAY